MFKNTTQIKITISKMNLSKDVTPKWYCLNNAKLVGSRWSQDMYIACIDGHKTCILPALMAILMHLCFILPDPESVELTIDGTTDKCSKGEDINFQFTGFGVVGKVGKIGIMRIVLLNIMWSSKFHHMVVTVHVVFFLLSFGLFNSSARVSLSVPT